MFLRPTVSKKIAKEAQNNPTQAKPIDQNKHQNVAERGGEAAPARGHYGLAVAPIPTPGASVSSRPFVFPLIF